MDVESDLPNYSTEMAKGSIWGLAGSIALKLISFLYAIIIARAASQNDVGIFYLCISILTIPGIFDDLGLPGSLARYIPYFQERNEKAKVRDLLKTSYFLVTVSSSIIVILLLWQAGNIGVIYHNAQLPFAIQLLSVFLILNNLLSMNTSYFQGRGDIRSLQFALNVQNVFKLILTVAFFFFFGASVLTLSAAFLLSFLIAFVSSLPEVIKKFSELPQIGEGLSKSELVKEIIPFGLTLSVIGSLWGLISSADRLLLGYLAAPTVASEIVAIYSIATTFAGVLLIFPASIGNIFLPLMSRLAAKNDYNKMRSVMETANRWVLIITIPVAVMFIGFSSQMLSEFYGVSYAKGSDVMAIFTFGLLISSFSYIISIAFAAIRMIKLEFKITIVVAAVNVLLNLIFIPMYGMVGSAMASVMGFVVMLALFSYYGKKTFGFVFPSEAFRLLLAGFFMFALILLIRPFSISLSFSLPHFLDAGLQSYISKILFLFFIGIIFVISSLFFVLVAIFLKCFKKEDVSIMKKGLVRLKLPQIIISSSEKLLSLGVS